MKNTILSILILVLAAGLNFGQTQPQKGQFKIRKGASIPAPAEQPQPGDKFAVDAASGNLLIEYVTPDGIAHHETIELATKTQPQITTDYKVVKDGVITYEYTLANGPAAKQSIGLFAIAMERPDFLANVKRSDEWKALPATHPMKGKPSRFSWWASDPHNTWAPGRSLRSPISFEVQALPGLTTAYVQGGIGPPKINGNMSAWLIEKISEATRLENNSIHVYVIGPKILLPSGVQPSSVITAIGTELLLAASKPEFADVRDQLVDLSNRLANTDTKSALSLKPILLQLGSTPLQRSFASAMTFDLDYCSTLK